MIESIRLWIVTFLWLGLLNVTHAADELVEPLTIADKHSEISQRVARIIEDLHYAKPRIDNSLSSAILDRYLDTLDGNRLYFLQSDYTSFGRYRYELDERVRNGDLEPVFEIFNTFRTRTAERVAYANMLLAEEPDFTVNESFQFDRSELGWARSEEELQEVWRKRVKNDALSLTLTEKPWEETSELLKQRYERLLRRVTQVTSDDVFETFMNSLAHTVDPHSSYLSPRNSEEYRIQMSLSYDGIGASLQLEDDYVTVTNIIPGGPAYIDGQLKPADRITAVGQGENGDLVDVIGWRLDEVVQLIRGPGGTVVHLQVLDAGAAPGTPERALYLVRDQVKLEEQAAKSSIIEVPKGDANYRIGVINVPSFYQDYAARSRGDENYTSTTRDVARLIQELSEEEGIDGLVVDLRQNGGGHLSEATELSGLFIDQGPVVQLRETRGNIQVLDDPNPDSVYDGPLAVLVDRYSASASEIFAAAIQDYKRGVIVGQQTFGKGSVQNLFDLDRFMRGSGYGQLTLTIGKYYRITGESTQHRGVMPDISLPSMVDASIVGESTRDSALPWDRIQQTSFMTDLDLDPYLQLLQTRHTERATEDPDYNHLVNNIEAAGFFRNQDEVSLNIDVRTAEREDIQAQQLARENERRVALGLNPIGSMEELDASEPTDVLLKQATQVVVDIATLSSSSGASIIGSETALIH